MDLAQLDAKALKRVISDASIALSRREKIEKAASELQRISKKYKLSNDELAAAVQFLRSSNSAKSVKLKTVRRKVKPKYQSKDGSKKWSGRGRSPSWVVNICRSEDISIDSFKTDARFLI